MCSSGFRINTLALCSLLVLSGCQTSPPLAVSIKPHYELPRTYAEHRAQQMYFVTSAGRLAYTDHGTGPAIVLLHGVPTSSWLYRKAIPGLQDHLRVISVDLLGYGSSDKPADEDGNYTAEQQALRVQELLNSLDVTRFAVMMHDMGGLVAWELLRQDPDAVSHLIVQNTIVHQNGFNHPNIKPGIIARQMTKAYSSRLTSAAILTMSFRSLGLSGDHKLSEAECEGYVIPMREGSDQALYAFFTHLNDSLYARLEDNKLTFRKFTGDTLILWGGQDEILTTEQLPFLEEHLDIKPENVHIYPDNKHFLVEEIPEQIVARVTDFIGDQRTE